MVQTVSLRAILCACWVEKGSVVGRDLLHANVLVSIQKEHKRLPKMYLLASHNAFIDKVNKNWYT